MQHTYSLYQLSQMKILSLVQDTMYMWVSIFSYDKKSGSFCLGLKNENICIDPNFIHLYDLMFIVIHTKEGGV